MKLYFNEISSATSRVRIALALKDMNVDSVPVTILGDHPENLAAAYREINPQGLVPALVTDHGTLITQSLAIIEYLDELQPQPPLLPKALEARALSRAIALAVAVEIHALVPPRVARRLSSIPGMNAAGIADWNQHWIVEGLHAVEQLLSRRSSGPFAVGPQPSIADIVLFPQLVQAERAGFDLMQWPGLAAIYAHLKTIPAFVDNGPAARK